MESTSFNYKLLKNTKKEKKEEKNMLNNSRESTPDGTRRVEDQGFPFLDFFTKNGR